MLVGFDAAGHYSDHVSVDIVPVQFSPAGWPVGWRCHLLFAHCAAPRVRGFHSTVVSPLQIVLTGVHLRLHHHVIGSHGCIASKSLGSSNSIKARSQCSWVKYSYSPTTMSPQNPGSRSCYIDGVCMRSCFYSGRFHPLVPDLEGCSEILWTGDKRLEVNHIGAI